MSDAPECSRWNGVLQVLREFETYLALDMPKLQIVNADDSEWSCEEYRRRRRQSQICSGKGVYLLFNVEEQLRYVGLALNAFDKRIWCHDGHVRRRWTDVVTFPDNWCFVAPALECFLIVKLQPPDNSDYRTLLIGERRHPYAELAQQFASQDLLLCLA